MWTKYSYNDVVVYTQGRILRRNYSVQTKKRICFCCFISSIQRWMALYVHTTMSDPMQHATPHSSSPTTSSKVLPWSSLSPDFNPNKHTWNELERRARGRVNAPGNVHELFQVLKLEWVVIPTHVSYNLIQSIPERCWAVIDSRGGHTPYFCACRSVSNYRVIELFPGREEC